MGRRRAYDTVAVVEAARDVFWQRGYELTSIADLEQRTGLDRSSLYNAFGSKQGLFEAALRSYLKEAIESRLGDMQQPDAGVAAIVAFFDGMAQTFRAYPERARNGCLMVNTLGELGAQEAHSAIAEAYRDSFRAAFGAALSHAAACGEVDSERVGPRANLLAAMTMGLFISARIDPADAADVCESVAAEVAGWQRRHPRGGSRR
jgi:TetR/AcrR family transcriptional regulator, transcriptional repressor for nem operon